MASLHGSSPGAQTSDSKKIKTLAPEQELTVVALRLAILEKAASGLGMLAFVWATVVLLGGFVSNLKPFDFWLVSALLLTEGTRVFSRSHELEWQHAAGSIQSRARLRSLCTRSSRALQAIRSMIHKPVESSDRSFSVVGGEITHLAPTSSTVLVVDVRRELSDHHVKRTWSWHSVPFIPYSDIFTAQHISLLLHLLQLFSATVTIGFSLARLIQQDYISESAAQIRTNLSSGLNIFYSLSLLEASIFMVERAYLEYNVEWRSLLSKVAEKSQVGEELLHVIRQFFYDVYSRCLKGSVFDGLNFDLVSYSITMIQSSSGKEQLGGALMLSAFCNQESFLHDTMTKIGTTLGVTERLLEMITWKSRQEREIRRAATSILYRLVSLSNNSFRVMSIAGALESILTLLLDEAEADGIDLANEFKLQGLRVLKCLAKDDKNCVQIGNTRGLLSILVSSIQVKSRDAVKHADQKTQMKIFKKTLQLLQRLVSTRGEHGEVLKQKIVRYVFTLRNLRDVLEHGEDHPACQELFVDIITSLALDEGIKESIGGTGGIIPNLLALFSGPVTDEESVQFRVKLKAGQAIYLLVLKSSRNSSRVCSTSFENFTETLHHTNPMVSSSAANILRSMWPDLCSEHKAGVLAEAEWIVQRILEAQGIQLEAFLGLAASAIPLLSAGQISRVFPDEVRKQELVSTLGVTFQLLPSLQMPRIRRHALELATALMMKDSYFSKQLTSEAFREHLRKMLATVSDVENYITFSGTMGITKHSQSMEDLVTDAIQNMAQTKQ